MCSVKIDVPQQIFGGRPEGLVEFVGMRIDERPKEPGGTLWEVSAKPAELVSGQLLHGPGLNRRRFDVTSAPRPDVPGGMGPALVDHFNQLVQELDNNPSLPGLLYRIAATIIAVTDEQVPQTIEWGSDVLATIPLKRDDGTSEPLFPQHSVHDVRIDPLAYRWSKLPQLMLRLRHQSVAELLTQAQEQPDQMVLQSSAALLEGTIDGGLYFAPLLGSMSPMMWGFAAPRAHQVVVYTFGRTISGLGTGPSRDQLDTLAMLTHFNPAHHFDTTSFDPAQLHKTAYSDAIDWWCSRVDGTLRDLFSPTTYVNPAGIYVPEAHQRWMLNLEQLFTRISAIVGHPRDQAAQLMIMFPAMDLVDTFNGTNGIGQLMTPKRIGKRIAAIESRMPARIRPLVMAPAYRALRAAEQVSEEFFVPGRNPDATTESRLVRLWNARRNATHGFNENAEILSEHTGRLPADIVLTPYVYLLDILTDRQYLLERIRRNCNTAHPGRSS